MRLLLIGLLAVSARAQTRLIELVPGAEAPAALAPAEAALPTPMEIAAPAPLPTERLEQLEPLAPLEPAQSRASAAENSFPRAGLAEAAQASPREGSLPLNALFDAQIRRDPAAVEVGAPAPKDDGDWAALDGLLSERMSIVATEATTDRFRRSVILTLRGEPSIALETAIERGFSKAHSLVPAQEERLPKVLNNYDDFRKLDVGWDEYKGEVERVKGLSNPHPNRVYAIKTDRPATLMAARDAIWEKSAEGYWKPVERHLEYIEVRNDNILMMLPDRWAVKHIDRKGLHFFTVGQDVDMGDGLVVKALPAGLWRFDLPLPEGWRSRLLRDAAASHDERAAVEAPQVPISSDGEGIVGRGGRSIFSSFESPGDR